MFTLLRLQKESNEMTSSQDELRNDQRVPTANEKETSSVGDEIDLSAYLAILWKRRRFIIVCSVLPSLIFALFLVASPSDCRVSYTFDIGLDEEARRISDNQLFGAGDMDILNRKSEEDHQSDDGSQKLLLQAFHEPENLERLAARLKKNGLHEYAQDMSEIDINLQASGSSLTLNVVGRPVEEVRRVSSFLGKNFEKVVQMDLVKASLDNSISVVRAMMTDIERNTFAMEFELEKEKAILVRLRELGTVGPNDAPGGIVLHVDGVRESRELLPVAYQIQVVNTGIIEIEETINADRKIYTYCQSVLALNEKLLCEMMNDESSHYKHEQFRSLLNTIAGEYKDKKDYLASHVRRLNEAVSTKVPVIGGPKVEFIPKGTTKKTTIVFVLLLALTTFSAFLRESIGKHLAKAS
jgi:hypothetical protein